MAAVAVAGFLVRVGAHVFLERVSVTERAPTHGARVRTLARVDAHVPPQVSPLAETLGAKGAAVRPLARVRAHVTSQIGRLREGFAAPVAGVGLALLFQVEAQPGRLSKDLTAAGTLVHDGARRCLAFKKKKSCQFL